MSLESKIEALTAAVQALTAKLESGNVAPAAPIAPAPAPVVKAAPAVAPAPVVAAPAMPAPPVFVAPVAAPAVNAFNVSVDIAATWVALSPPS